MVSSRNQSLDKLGLLVLELVQQSRQSSIPAELLAHPLLQDLSAVIEELQVTEEELRTNNEELLRAQQSIEQERQRYIDLFEFAPDGYLITDIKGQILDGNKAAIQLLRGQKELLANQYLSQFIDPGYQRAYYSKLCELENSREVIELEAQLHPWQTESLGDFSLRAMALRDSKGVASELLWQIRDISDQKTHERLLREANESLERQAAENRHQKALLDAIFEADPSGIAVLTGPDLQIVYTNPAYRYIIPDPFVEPIGKTYDQVWTDRSHEAIRDRFYEVLNTGRPYQITGVEHRFPDHTTRNFTVQARRIEWQNEPAILVILWDITELKRAEEALRSVALFPEENPHPIFRISLRGDWMYINPGSRKFFPDYQVGQPAPAFWQEIVREVSTTKVSKVTEFAHQDRLFAFNAVPILKAGYINLYGQDITEQHRYSDSLKQANSRLRSVLNSITELYAVFDREWRIVDLNPTAEADYFRGKPSGAMVGKNLWEAFPDVKTGEIAQALLEAMETGQPKHVEAESHVTGKWYEMHAYPRDGQLELYMHDISERKRAERYLQHYRLMFERSRDIFLTVRLRDGKILDANPAAEKAYGYTHSELLSLKITDLRASETHPQIDWQMQQADAAGILFETLHRDKAGRTFPVEVSSQGAEWEGERVILSAIRDISDRKMAEDLAVLKTNEAELASQETQKQAAELEALFSQMTDGVLLYDLKGIPVRANEAVIQSFGFDPSGLPPEESARRFQVTRVDGTPWKPGDFIVYRALQGETVKDVRLKFTATDGKTLLLSASGNPIRAHDQITGAFIIFHDITEQERRQVALREAAAQTIRIELQRRLLDQREQERMQIARDLHDGPMQEILGAIFTLEGVMPQERENEQAREMRSAIDTLQRQLNELRSYAGELRPPALGKFGLNRAIRSHLDTWQEKHPEIKVKYTCRQNGEMLPERLQLPLFRIYQEIINNIGKHAKATEVSIRLEVDHQGAAHLIIEDNGQGFVVPQDWLGLARSGHLGLVGMRERVEAIGGTIEVTSTPGQGTRVAVEVPQNPPEGDLANASAPL